MIPYIYRPMFIVTALFLTFVFSFDMAVLPAPLFAKKPKVTICHIPPDNPENLHTISVSENALAAHLAHGDEVGACEDPPPDVGPQGDMEETVEVCHFPPGNPANFHTIRVSENALEAHLGHGDVEGSCADVCAP